MHVEDMLSTHPKTKAGGPPDALVRCIEACFSCAQTCTSCADACLGEEMVAMLARCIRLNLDCADVCAATGRLATRQTGDNPATLRAQLQACAEACGACAAECEGHAETMEHCRVCAEDCRACEDACLMLAGTLS